MMYRIKEFDLAYVLEKFNAIIMGYSASAVIADNGNSKMPDDVKTFKQ